jgi:glutaminyl-tRNA synthetase
MSSSAETLANTTWANLASAMSSLKLVDDLRWASPLEIKKSLENAFTETFGSKDEYTKAQAAAGKAGKGQAKNTKPNGAAAKDSNSKDAAGTQAGSSSATSAPTTTNMFEEGFLAALHPVGGNPQINERLREEHLKATGGLVHTRFPPEPNGTYFSALSF